MSTVELSGRPAELFAKAMYVSYLDAVLGGDHDFAAWAWLARATREGMQKKPPTGGTVGVACPGCWLTEPQCVCLPKITATIDEVLGAHGLDVEGFPWQYGMGEVG